MSNDLKVWVEPKRHSVEGHTAQCTLTFNGRVIWGPYHCHNNTRRLQAALAAADPRFQLEVSPKRKTVEGHTYSISVMAGGHVYLDRLSTHGHMVGLCKAIDDCLAAERGRTQRDEPDPAPPSQAPGPAPQQRPEPSQPSPPRPQATRPNGRQDFEIAVVCALTLEADAVDALFDHHWDDDGPPYDKAPGDPNAYSTGAIGRHNVVLAHMPGMGKANAAAVAVNCRSSFPNIKLAVVVGICGAVPFTHDGVEIVLGDVVVSDGVVQYDFGRSLPEGFVQKDTLLDSLGRPNTEIRALLAKLKGIRHRQALRSRMADYLKSLRTEPELAAAYPGTAHDRLFEAAYRHVRDGMSCDECNCNGPLVSRNRLVEDAPKPAVHFGLIASGDTVMKSGVDRDRIARQKDIVGFEMESAGVWDSFPCIVIKGACDYADSHKSKGWQRYAAATAAACMKAFLNHWVPH